MPDHLGWHLAFNAAGILAGWLTARLISWHHPVPGSSLIGVGCGVLIAVGYWMALFVMR